MIIHICTRLLAEEGLMMMCSQVHFNYDLQCYLLYLV